MSKVFTSACLNAMQGQHQQAAESVARLPSTHAEQNLCLLHDPHGDDHTYHMLHSLPLETTPYNTCVLWDLPRFSPASSNLMTAYCNCSPVCICAVMLYLSGFSLQELSGFAVKSFHIY